MCTSMPNLAVLECPRAGPAEGPPPTPLPYKARGRPCLAVLWTSALPRGLHAPIALPVHRVHRAICNFGYQTGPRAAAARRRPDVLRTAPGGLPAPHRARGARQGRGVPPLSTWHVAAPTAGSLYMLLGNTPNQAPALTDGGCSVGQKWPYGHPLGPIDHPGKTGGHWLTFAFFCGV